MGGVGIGIRFEGVGLGESVCVSVLWVVGWWCWWVCKIGRNDVYSVYIQMTV